MNILKGGGRKADRLGILRSEEWHTDEFPKFSLCVIYPKLGDEEDSTLEITTGADKN